MPVSFWNATIKATRQEIWKSVFAGGRIEEFELRLLVGDPWKELTVVDIAFLRVLTTKYPTPPSGKHIMLEIEHARAQLIKINTETVY